MKKTQKTDLGTLFQEALRTKIGDKRYATWFSDGVRFDLSEDVLSVRVKSDFIYLMLNSSYAHTLRDVARDLLGRTVEIDVVRETPRQVPANDPAPEADELTSALSRGAVRPRRAQEESARGETEPNEPPRPAKRRGRPPKNAVRADARDVGAANARGLFDVEGTSDGAPYAPFAPSPLPTSEFPASRAPIDDPYAQPRVRPVDPYADPYARPVDPYAEPYARPVDPYAEPYARPVDPYADARAPQFGPRASEQALPSETPKRRRGRPRKNPVPERTSEELARVAPSRPSASFADASLDFADIYNRASASESARAAAVPNAPLADGLSDAERVALAVGDFNAPLPTAPRKRGRPKGSTNRRASSAPSLLEQDDDISRDANGFNIARRPKEAPRVKTASGEARFASLRTFVEGFSNRLARRVVDVAIAEPGALNPIFICGPTSVGKTHLLEGVCDAYSRMQGVKPPLYMTAEQFTSAFIQSWRGGGAFRDRFRDVSLFALDDLHFLEGKAATQTELLNVLDYLRSRRAQAIFTANRPLSELTKLRGELTTRIESGVVCKIEPPERETLAQIFRQMAFERRLIVSDEVCRYVVSRFATHARQLSGALNRLYATHLTTGAPIDVDLARVALADLATASFRSIRLDDVERVVQDVFGLEQNALKSSSRAKRCADPRALAMWIARKHTRAALTEIGAFFGGRKHTAVLAAQKKVDEWLRVSEPLDAGAARFSAPEAIERIERELTRG